MYLDIYADIPHGLDQDAGNGYHYPMGSVMVKPGCTFYVYHENNFGGGYEKYEGPTIISRVSSFFYFWSIIHTLLLGINDKHMCSKNCHGLSVIEGRAFSSRV